MQKPMENPGYVDSLVLKGLKCFTAALKQRVTELLQIRPADHVVDVGCGPGSDTIPMATLVGDKGLVVGIDYDVAMIDQADQLARESGVASRVLHAVADACSLPLSSGSFDACRSERLLQHVADPGPVLDEIFRVTKKGGRIVLADTDWATLSIDAPDFEVERRIVHFRAKMYQNGCAGRQLYRLVQEHRLQAVSVEVYPIIWTDYETFRATSFALNDFERRLIDSQTVTKTELQLFLNNLSEAERHNVFYASGNIVLVAGRKP